MKYLKIFTDFVIDMEILTYEERGRLFTAMLEYAANGSASALAGNERYVWGTAKKQIDAQRKSYESKCESAGNARGHRNQNKNSEINMKSEEEQEQDKEQEQNKNTIKRNPRSRRKRDFKERSVTDEDFKDLFLNLDNEKEVDSCTNVLTI